VFRGVSNLSLDAKGRVAIPARYRESLRASDEGRLIVTIGLDGCLFVYPQTTWEGIETALMALPNMDANTRAVQRLLVGYATDVEMDSQSRILIAPSLRDHAKLGKHVVLVGQGNKFELWDESIWASKREEWLQADGLAQGLNEALASLSL